MSICTQIIKRYCDGITVTDNARRLVDDACNLHCSIFIPKKRASQKADSLCHQAPDHSNISHSIKKRVAPLHTLQSPDFTLCSCPTVSGSCPTCNGSPTNCGPPTHHFCVIKPWCLSFFTFLKQMTRVLGEIMFLAVYMHLHLHLHLVSLSSHYAHKFAIM